jgi:hypothetical protein
MDLKKLEIIQILNTPNDFNIDVIIKNIKQKFNSELKNFKYIDNKKKISLFKNKYIKYVSYDNKLNYGGFFYKTENINGQFFIYLINKNKIPWKINYNQYYIFYNDYIRTNNDSKRTIFDIFINNYENT